MAQRTQIFWQWENYPSMRRIFYAKPEKTNFQARKNILNALINGVSKWYAYKS